MRPLSVFDQLLQAAAAQPEPQRLLFVFAASELPPGATGEERARYEAGQGGTLNPLACVDKAPFELSSFDALVQESRQACPPWQVVFIAALSGREGREPTDNVVEGALRTMVENVRSGRLAGYLAVDSSGAPLLFS